MRRPAVATVTPDSSPVARWAKLAGHLACARRGLEAVSDLPHISLPLSSRATLRSNTRRSPCKVSQGSWCWIISDSGVTIPASPPVAMTADGPSSCGNAAAHGIDETRVAVDGTGLDRLDGRLADHVAWLDKLDTAQRRGMFEERLHADRDPGRDGAAEVLARGRDGVERRGRAHVHDDGRPAVQVDGTDRVGNTVRSDVLRVVVEDRHPGADPRLDHDKRDVEPERAPSP